MSATRFYLMRHAKTVWNREKRIQGQENSPLSAGGEEQAALWAERLAAEGYQRILTSDLGRVCRTAEIVNRGMGLPVHRDPRLREQDWGAWTGRVLPELRREVTDEIVFQERRGWAFRPPGGESRTEVWERSQAALLHAAGRWPGERILVITHQGVMKALLYRLCGRRFLPEEPKIVNPYHLHGITARKGALELTELNALALAETPGGDLR